LLQIKDIRKSYGTGDLVQKALDGVSLNLREHELVSILGPSGSGKSTLLNVIGGLDQYDSGDLIINGISTKKYTDRDWDSYRNHTIGFIFQSYNLIPHQTVLANVELALTISGVSRRERRCRAEKALQDVGLGKQIHKKPNQMSGGQMQRVAIARALVNNPSIVLADEPTGALDSETSVQVMELLKEVSKDRLVVMVTHNPELAERYSDRIVRVKDGRIIDDSNPFEVDETEFSLPEHKNMGKSSMSFFEALTLSFNNLKTKLGRTLLTSFAGSIGIIGIALIIALSTGFQDYVDQVQEETLSNYPLTIQSESADMSALMVPPGGKPEEGAPEDTVSEQEVLSKVFAHIGANDLASFKSYIEENWDEIGPAVHDIQYDYGIAPRIFTNVPEDMFQLHPTTLLKRVTGTDALSSLIDLDAFHPIVDNRSLLDSQYDILRGRWPEKYDELVFVLPSAYQMQDYLAYALGMKDIADLHEMVDCASKGEEFHSSSAPMRWSYDDLMELSFRLVNTPDLYQYNSQYNVWEDMSGDTDYLQKLIAEGEELRVVGVVCAKKPGSGSLWNGIGYHPSLSRHIIERASQSPIVLEQLENPDIDVFSGKAFDDPEQKEDLDFGNMISIDGNAITDAFGMDVNMDAIMGLLKQYLNDVSSSITVDTSAAQQDFAELFYTVSSETLNQFAAGNADGNGVSRMYLKDAEGIVDAGLSSGAAQSAIAGLAQSYNMSPEEFTKVIRPLMLDMVVSHISRGLIIDNAPEAQPAAAMSYAGDTPKLVFLADVSESEPAVPEEVPPEAPAEEPEAPPEELPGEPDDTLPQEPGGTLPDNPLPDINIPEVDIPEYEPPVSIENLYAELRTEEIDSIIGAYAGTPVFTGTALVMGQKMMEPEILANLSDKISGFGNLLIGYLGGSVHVDGDMLASAFHFNMDEEDLQRLISVLSSKTTERSAAGNLRKLGYADLDSPSAMSIYMMDFDSKDAFLQFLDEYNQKVQNEGHEEMVIRYTDMTGMMMDSVKTMINSISYVLIAFVAVSLLVSSIMIGIITYISVMERTREIGVLRAMGASKRNISQVFNAETFIIGLCSGLIGVGITILLLIPGNRLLRSLLETDALHSYLPLSGALILIVISMLLTLLGGLIPSKQAAKKDPVIALRSE
jgi:putative ABC transport system permease protein